MWTSKRSNKGGNKASLPIRMFHNVYTWWAQHRYVYIWFQAINNILCPTRQPSSTLLNPKQAQLGINRQGISSPQKKPSVPCHTNTRTSRESNTAATSPWPGSWSANHMYQKRVPETLPHPKLLWKNRNSKLFPEWRHLKPWIHQSQEKRSLTGQFSEDLQQSGKDGGVGSVWAKS